MFHAKKTLALLLAAASALCFALTPPAVNAAGLDGVDFGSMTDLQGGEFDLENISDLFGTLGGNANQSTASGESLLEKIKNLLPEGSSGGSSAATWQPPMFTVDSAVSEDGKKLSVTVYAHNAVGLDGGTITVKYSGCAFNYASMGVEAKKVNDSLGNGFFAEVIDTDPGKAHFGFFLKEPLWDADKFAKNVKPGADPLVIDIADFDIVTFWFRLRELDQCAVEITCDVAGVYPAAISCGDVDGNGKVEADDARTILRASVGLDPLDGMTENKRVAFDRTSPAQIADVDGDGTLTPADARLALRISVKLEENKTFTLKAAYSPAAHAPVLAPDAKAPQR